MNGSDLKLGMRVRRTCVDHSGGMITGTAGIVTGLVTENGVVKAVLDGACNTDTANYHSPLFLEPAEPEPSPAPFYVGQTVRCVRGSIDNVSLVVGETYEVRGVTEEQLYILDNVSCGYWDKTRFVPADPEPSSAKPDHRAPFYVGQNVRCVNDAGNDDLVRDMVYTITTVDSDGDICVEGKRPVFYKWRFVPAEPNEHSADWNMTAPFFLFDTNSHKVGTVSDVHLDGTITVNLGKGESMEKETITYEKLAERMKDKLAGYGNRAPGASRTVFLEKAGECDVVMRDVTISLTAEDIEELLKKKGMTKALGVFEAFQTPDMVNVGIVKFVKRCCDEK